MKGLGIFEKIIKIWGQIRPLSVHTVVFNGITGKIFSCLSV